MRSRLRVSRWLGAEHICLMSSPSLMARAVCVAGVMLLSVGSSGCSYAFVHKPSALGEVSTGEPQRLEQPGPTRLECTSSNAAPIVDAFLAVPLIGVGVLGIVATGVGSGAAAVGALARAQERQSRSGRH
jgi:hypothetical protein